jgi:hypothetical protein
MKKRTILLVACVLGALTGTSPAASSATLRGTSILHYMTRNSLTTTEAGSNVTGSVKLQLNEQGRSSLQKFDLQAAGLQANTTYALLAAVGEDTNQVSVAEVTTDAKGRVKLSYMKKGQGRGNSRKDMPDALNPLTDLRAISLQDLALTQSVAFAWIDQASSYQYLVKRNLTPADSQATAAGSISIKAPPQRVQFTLLADGLAPTNNYLLSLNSNIVESVTTDSEGRLRITNWSTSAPPVLELRSLALLDAGSNTVLSTTLPK